MKVELSPSQRDEVNALMQECQDDLEPVLFRLVFDRDEARAKVSEMRDALGESEPWPLLAVMNRLVLAAQHLLTTHNCDCQHHEEVSACIARSHIYFVKMRDVLLDDCGKDFINVHLLRDPLCTHCGQPATCIGRYEGPGSIEFACDKCCAHGNEDGFCYRIGCGNGFIPKRELEPTIKLIGSLISGAVHPDTAVRRVLVDLKPFRSELARLEKLIAS